MFLHTPPKALNYRGIMFNMSANMNQIYPAAPLRFLFSFNHYTGNNLFLRLLT